VISNFDAAYSAYNDFQNGIERYWTLRWLEQNEVGELDAAVMKDGLVRADTLPLVFRVPGTESLPRGCRVRVRLTGTDLLTLDLHAQFVARVDADAPAAETSADAGTDAEDENDSAGPLTLAIELDDAGAAAPAEGPPAGAG